MLRATLQLRREEYRAAIADFTAAIHIQPTANGYIQRAAARWAQGDEAGGDADLEEAQALASDDRERSQVLFILGRRHQARRDLDKAREAFDEAIRLDARNDRALHERGHVHLDKGDPEAAIEDFDAELRLVPNAHGFHMELSLTPAGAMEPGSVGISARRSSSIPGRSRRGSSGRGSASRTGTWPARPRTSMSPSPAPATTGDRSW